MQQGGETRRHQRMHHAQRSELDQTGGNLRRSHQGGSGDRGRRAGPGDFKEARQCAAMALTNPPALLSFGGQIQELPFHAIDLSEICSDVVIATAPPGHEAEAAARECPRRTCAAPLGITVMVNSIFNGWRFEEAWLDNL